MLPGKELHRDLGSGDLVEDYGKVNTHPGEYSIVQLGEETNKETDKPRYEVNLCNDS